MKLPRLVHHGQAPFLAIGLAASIWGSRAAQAQNIREDFYVPNEDVYAAVLLDGTLYIGGAFTQVGPTTGHAIPLDAITGLPVSGFPRVNGIVRVVHPDGSGGWYLAGAFTTVGGIARSNLAHILSDNTVSAWNPNANGEVRTLAVSGLIVYAGGSFTNIGGQARNRIAALSTTVNTNMATPWDPREC